MSEPFKGPVHCHHQCFLLSLLVGLCLPQLLSTTSGNHEIGHFLSDILDKCPWGKGLLHWVGSEPGQIKTVLQAGSSGNHQVGHIKTVLWNWVFEWARAALPSVVVMAASCHPDCGLLVQGSLRAEDNRLLLCSKRKNP